jgi:hypothetical protein
MADALYMRQVCTQIVQLLHDFPALVIRTGNNVTKPKTYISECRKYIWLWASSIHLLQPHQIIQMTALQEVSHQNFLCITFLFRTYQHIQSVPENLTVFEI